MNLPAGTRLMRAMVCFKYDLQVIDLTPVETKAQHLLYADRCPARSLLQDARCKAARRSSFRARFAHKVSPLSLPSKTTGQNPVWDWAFDSVIDEGKQATLTLWETRTTKSIQSPDARRPAP